MSSVTVEIQIGKTEKDMADALISIVKGLKQKKAIAGILAEEIPALMKIAGEFGDLKQEITDTSEIALGAYIATELEKALKE